MQQRKPTSLSLLGVVCERDKQDKATAVLEKHQAYLNMVVMGKGTASSRTLSYLGLGDTEKTVIWSIFPSGETNEVLLGIEKTLKLQKPGNGICFVSPIRHGCHPKLLRTSSESDGDTIVKDTIQHDLILVIVNRGYTEEAMEAARSAGARGGTVMHARGCGLAGAEQFFGITIQPEKEMIMIVADSGISCGIMDAIAQRADGDEKMEAISFSLPVHSVKGLDGAKEA